MVVPNSRKESKDSFSNQYKHMSSYEVEIISSPDHVCRLSYTIVAKSSQVSAMIPLGQAESLGHVLAHTEVHRILQKPTTLVNGWDLILDCLK